MACMDEMHYCFRLMWNPSHDNLAQSKIQWKLIFHLENIPLPYYLPPLHPNKHLSTGCCFRDILLVTNAGSALLTTNYWPDERPTTWVCNLTFVTWPHSPLSYLIITQNKQCVWFWLPLCFISVEMSNLSIPRIVLL